MAAPYEPSDAFEEQLITSGYFHPNRDDEIRLDKLLGQFEVEDQAARQTLDRLEALGFAQRKAPPAARDGHPPTWTKTALGERESEDLQRRRGLRHACLVHQHAYALEHRLLALIVAPYVGARRNHQSMLTCFPRKVLCFYLDEGEEAVGAALEALQAKNWIADNADRPSMTHVGHRRYIAEVAGSLGLDHGKHVLDPVVEKTLDIFFSWQSEFRASRSALGEALKDTIERLNRLRVTRPLNLLQATSLGDGAVRIDVAIQERIRGCNVFVADVTPVAADGDRLRLNDNVLVEVGYALASKDPGQIVLVALERDIEVGRKVAFDIANIQRLTMKAGKKAEFRGRLQAELDAILRTRGWLHDLPA